MHLSADRYVRAAALLLVLQILRGVQGDGFNCSINIGGTSKYPTALSYSEATISCEPEPALTSATGANAKLAMVVHPSLQQFSSNFTGKGSGPWLARKAAEVDHPYALRMPTM